MFCKNCGKEIPDGQELCEECAKLAQNEIDNSTTINETAGQTINVNSNNNYNDQNTNYNNNYQQNSTVNNNPQAKSKLCAGLLGIFLGAFGVHNFYLGKYGLAIAQLLITLLSCFILSEVSAIWGLIEGIMILTGSINTDGNGVPLKD